MFMGVETAVQSIGNLGLQLGHGKEQWMAPLHPFILQSVSCVKDFLDKLIDIDNENGHPLWVSQLIFYRKHKRV
ncbi:RasGAP-activating-like protein 1 [Acipenser ruthenus]|uniref:RasGAP-activating-like protein 1 n=1 Tax=Acipenser ruthenus TaxID=7906 RepID=A0A444U033_ACIRT|nr:RasGAP-activating-like protein 1 [Acipenser ruthenus]